MVLQLAFEAGHKGLAIAAQLIGAASAQLSHGQSQLPGLAHARGSSHGGQALGTEETVNATRGKRRERQSCGIR